MCELTISKWATEPRDNYTYRFTPQGQYGSYFYHGHFGPAFSDVSIFEFLKHPPSLLKILY